MKTSLLILLASTASLSGAVNAQGGPPSAPQRAVQGAQVAQVGQGAQSAQAALQAYAAAGSAEARISAIEKLRIRPPAPTAANIALLRARLGGPAAVKEKTGLIGVLGSLYRETRDQGARSQIGADLKRHAFSPQRDIAQAAIYAVSRGPSTFEDLLAVLEHGRKTDVLDADAYAGELAHNLRFVPQDRQAELIKLIVGQKSAYGAAVLAGYLHDPEMISKMSPDSVAALQSFLRTTEPQFPMAIGRFGYADVIDYESWLDAYANLHERMRAGGYRATVFEQLNAQDTDPRKIIAFLSSPTGQAFMQAVGQRAAFEKSFARATSYAESFPGDMNITPLYDRAAASLAALK
ncbi:hypothetical protein [Massilia genomosp. 1]|uniref:DUF2059 domain-containing protein n=1 Tax=Massilia genomosp. 1 TaxID=2609280 RepID=A0ABX0MX13_9BURK|nr:hypothetical protein [Massilia genomosp. 1]NHZ64102.1 hypothetical protein [Massilia genomosp. 1]